MRKDAVLYLTTSAQRRMNSAAACAWLVTPVWSSVSVLTPLIMPLPHSPEMHLDNAIFVR